MKLAVSMVIKRDDTRASLPCDGHNVTHGIRSNTIMQHGPTPHAKQLVTHFSLVLFGQDNRCELPEIGWWIRNGNNQSILGEGGVDLGIRGNETLPNEPLEAALKEEEEEGGRAPEQREGEEEERERGRKLERESP